MRFYSYQSSHNFRCLFLIYKFDICIKTDQIPASITRGVIDPLTRPGINDKCLRMAIIARLIFIPTPQTTRQPLTSRRLALPNAAKAICWKLIGDWREVI